MLLHCLRHCVVDTSFSCVYTTMMIKNLFITLIATSIFLIIVRFRIRRQYSARFRGISRLDSFLLTLPWYFVLRCKYFITMSTVKSIITIAYNMINENDNNAYEWTHLCNLVTWFILFNIFDLLLWHEKTIKHLFDKAPNHMLSMLIASYSIYPKSHSTKIFDLLQPHLQYVSVLSKLILSYHNIEYSCQLIIKKTIADGFSLKNYNRKIVIIWACLFLC